MKFIQLHLHVSDTVIVQTGVYEDAKDSMIEFYVASGTISRYKRIALGWDKELYNLPSHWTVV